MVSYKQVLVNHYLHVHNEVKKPNEIKPWLNQKNTQRQIKGKIYRKTYQCNLCSRGCSSKKDLNNHVKRIHVSGLNETYLCEPCNMSFMSEEKFMKHARIIHKEKHEKSEIQEVHVHEEKIDNNLNCKLQ